MLVRKNDGRIQIKRGWLRFPSEIVEAAGGRTRVVRFLIRDEASEGAGPGRGKLKWARGFVAEVPDLDAVEAAVIDWLRGAAGVSGADMARMSMSKMAEGCTVVELDPSDPACNELNRGECYATVCDGGGGGDWPPPEPDWGDPFDPPPSGPNPGGGGSPSEPGSGGPGEGCDPNAIDQPAGCEPPGDDGSFGPVESKQELIDWHERCSGYPDATNTTSYSQAVEDSYEGNLADFILGGLGRGSVSGFPNPLDGYQTYHFGAGAGLVSFILETKLTDEPPLQRRSNVDQVKAQIDFLAAQYQEALDRTAGGTRLGAPGLLLMSQNQRDEDVAFGGTPPGWWVGKRIWDGSRFTTDYHQEIIDHATSKGVLLYHGKVDNLGGWRNLNVRVMNDVSLVTSTNAFVDWLGGVVETGMEGVVVETVVPILFDCDAKNGEHKERPPPGG